MRLWPDISHVDMDSGKPGKTEKVRELDFGQGKPGKLGKVRIFCLRHSLKKYSLLEIEKIEPRKWCFSFSKDFGSNKKVCTWFLPKFSHDYRENGQGIWQFWSEKTWKSQRILFSKVHAAMQAHAPIWEIVESRVYSYKL